jgi:hypothetical protein
LKLLRLAAGCRSIGQPFQWINTGIFATGKKEYVIVLSVAL